jgi:hypothetical protein
MRLKRNVARSRSAAKQQKKSSGRGDRGPFQEGVGLSLSPDNYRLNTAVGIATAAIMWLTGVGDPILWGTIAFLLNFVQILGPLLAR